MIAQGIRFYLFSSVDDFRLVSEERVSPSFNCRKGYCFRFTFLDLWKLPDVCFSCSSFHSSIIGKIDHSQRTAVFRRTAARDKIQNRHHRKINANRTNRFEHEWTIDKLVTFLWYLYDDEKIKRFLIGWFIHSWIWLVVNPESGYVIKQKQRLVTKGASCCNRIHPPLMSLLRRIAYWVDSVNNPFARKQVVKSDLRFSLE